MKGMVIRMHILQECENAQRIGISGHVRPDGDCIGSCLALYRYLKKNLNDRVYIKVYLEDPSHVFEKMAGFSEIVTDYPAEESFDVFFALDCNEERLGQAKEYFCNASKKINIDHHISNVGCGDVNYIKPQVGSTSELIYDLIMAEGKEDSLDKELAEAIYIGVIHDTGVFQYSNTTSKTLHMAAKLIEYGFDFPKLIEETFYQRTYLQTQILAYVLLNSTGYMDGQCMVGTMQKEMIEQYGASSHDFEGIVNQLRNIKGVHCAVFIHQTGEEEYKVSLRTDEWVNAVEVVSVFGGGGHVRAAGCTMQGSLDKCTEGLLVQIEEQLKKNGAL